VVDVLGVTFCSFVFNYFCVSCVMNVFRVFLNEELATKKSGDCLEAAHNEDCLEAAYNEDKSQKNNMKKPSSRF
jgi:hypothetical protein